MSEQFEIIRNGKVVAEGVIFSSGVVVVAWLGDKPSTVTWPNVSHMAEVHGHEGTRIESVARLDRTAIDHLLSNRTQDHCENINCEFRAGSNADYVWNQRDMVLDMLSRRPLRPAHHDGGPAHEDRR